MRSALVRRNIESFDGNSWWDGLSNMCEGAMARPNMEVSNGWKVDVQGHNAEERFRARSHHCCHGGLVRPHGRDGEGDHGRRPGHQGTRRMEAEGYSGHRNPDRPRPHAG